MKEFLDQYKGNLYSVVIMDEKHLDLSLLNEQIGDASIVKDIVLKYLTHLENQLVHLRSLSPEESHLEEIHRIAHSIRGGTGNIGALTLQALAKELEYSAKRGQAETCGSQIEKLWEAFITLRE